MTEFNRERWPEQEVDLSIEKVEKYNDNDSSFFTELRVLNGPQRGELKRNLWFRTKKDGNPRRDTSNLLMALTGNPDAPSYDLLDKIFRTTPWYPQGSDYPIFTKIEHVGEVVEDQDGVPLDPTPDAW